ncbi:MAG: LAGLIDADG family homing endonuclease, partial [Candidatus Aenigmatarchaeota archaeon]
FTKIRKGRPVRFDCVQKLLEVADRGGEEFHLTQVAYSSKNTIEIPEIDNEFSYFLGMMLGDGSIIGERQTLGFSSADEELQNRFKEMMNRFNASVRPVHGKDYDYKSSNRSVAWLLQQIGLPAGKKKDMKIPDCVLTSKENLSAFLSGLMDTD